MRIHTASLLPAAVAALVLGLSAAPAAAATCRPGHGQRTIARSSRAVLLGTVPSRSGYRLWGCSRRSGARRRLATGGEDRALRTPMLRGTHVGYVDASLDGTFWNVVSDDALRRRRHIVVATVGAQVSLGLRMGDDGALAWRDTVAPGQRLRLWRRGDTTRLVDEGFGLTGMRFTGRTLRWRHDGVGHAVPPPAASACHGRPGDGSTPTVDIVHTAFATNVACWRATGASLTFPAATPGRGVPAPAVTSILATTGSWVAATTSDTIEVRDLLNPAAARSVPWRGTLADLVIDEHGSLAWTYGWSGSGHPPRPPAAVLVDDAAGTHAYGDAWPWEPVALARDGSVLRWLVGAGDGHTIISTGAATLAPLPVPAS